jgi:hypothetical protein
MRLAVRTDVGDTHSYAGLAKMAVPSGVKNHAAGLAAALKTLAATPAPTHDPSRALTYPFYVRQHAWHGVPARITGVTVYVELMGVLGNDDVGVDTLVFDTDAQYKELRDRLLPRDALELDSLTALGMWGGGEFDAPSEMKQRPRVAVDGDRGHAGALTWVQRLLQSAPPPPASWLEPLADKTLGPKSAALRRKWTETKAALGVLATARRSEKNRGLALCKDASGDESSGVESDANSGEDDKESGAGNAPVIRFGARKTIRRGARRRKQEQEESDGEEKGDEKRAKKETKKQRAVMSSAREQKRRADKATMLGRRPRGVVSTRIPVAPAEEIDVESTEDDAKDDKKEAAAPPGGVRKRERLAPSPETSRATEINGGNEPEARAPLAKRRRHLAEERAVDDTPPDVTLVDSSDDEARAESRDERHGATKSGTGSGDDSVDGGGDGGGGGGTDVRGNRQNNADEGPSTSARVNTILSSMFAIPSDALSLSSTFASVPRSPRSPPSAPHSPLPQDPTPPEMQPSPVDTKDGSDAVRSTSLGRDRERQDGGGKPSTPAKKRLAVHATARLPTTSPLPSSLSLTSSPSLPPTHSTVSSASPLSRSLVSSSVPSPPSARPLPFPQHPSSLPSSAHLSPALASAMAPRDVFFLVQCADVVRRFVRHGAPDCALGDALRYEAPPPPCATFECEEAPGQWHTLGPVVSRAILEAWPLVDQSSVVYEKGGGRYVVRAMPTLPGSTCALRFSDLRAHDDSVDRGSAKAEEAYVLVRQDTASGASIRQIRLSLSTDEKKKERESASTLALNGLGPLAELLELRAPDAQHPQVAVDALRPQPAASLYELLAASDKYESPTFSADVSSSPTSSAQAASREFDVSHPTSSRALLANDREARTRFSASLRFSTSVNKNASYSSASTPSTSPSMLSALLSAKPRTVALSCDSSNALYAGMYRFAAHFFLSTLSVPPAHSRTPWTGAPRIVIESIAAVCDLVQECRYRRYLQRFVNAYADRGVPVPDADERLVFSGTPCGEAASTVRDGFKMCTDTKTMSAAHMDLYASAADRQATPCASTGRQTVFICRMLVNGASTLPSSAVRESTDRTCSDALATVGGADGGSGDGNGGRETKDGSVPLAADAQKSGVEADRGAESGTAPSTEFVWLEAARGHAAFPRLVEHCCPQNPAPHAFISIDDGNVLPLFLVTYHKLDS